MLKNNSLLKGWCRLRPGSLIVDGKTLISEPDAEPTEFLKTVYKTELGDYSRFFKMDFLCKAGYVAAAVLLSKHPEWNTESSPFQKAMVLSNRASSLDSDRKHLQTISDTVGFFPSPAVFVYTLPNIVAGEIAIRFGFKGEQAFFIFETFNPDFISDYVNSLFQEGTTDRSLAGWVEAEHNSYDVFLYLLQKSNEPLSTLKQELKTIFQNT